jgi:hypothetical protein
MLTKLNHIFFTGNVPYPFLFNALLSVLLFRNIFNGIIYILKS